MVDRQTALHRLRVGDIFHARNPHNRASLVCLVTAVDDHTIHARRITTQDDVQFDRQTGNVLGGGKSSVDCVAPLPPDIHATFLQLDRKYRAFTEMDRRGIEPDFERYRLTPDEKRALLFISDHVSTNRM